MRLAADDLDAHKGKGLTDEHVKNLSHIWKTIVRTTPDPYILVTAIDYEWAETYEGLRRSQGVRGQTIARELSAVKRVLVRAKRKGMIQDLPDWPTVRRDPPDEKKRGKFWAPEAVRAFVSELRAECPDAADEVEFIAMTGLRWKEMKRVRATWVEPAPKGSRVEYMLRLPPAGTKTRRERIVGLAAPAFEIVRRRMEAKPDRELVFSQHDFKKRRAALCKRLGFPTNLTLRDMRHTYATVALKMSSDPTAVLRAMGHSDLKMTERYLSAVVVDIVDLGQDVAGFLEAKKDDDDDE